ncbi:unnamed protein product [Alopecurus aequalis]
MGSGDPLGAPLPEDAKTQQSETIIIDGSPDKQGDAPDHRHSGKRKSGALGEDEIQAFASMADAVKEVTAAIKESKHTGMHLYLYSAIMEAAGFTEEALMLALIHLVDHKAQCVNFIGMAEQHMTLWLSTFLGKYYR